MRGRLFQHWRVRSNFLTVEMELKKIFFKLLAAAAAAAAKLLQSCPTLGNPRDGSPPDSTVPGILRARTLECVAISFSNAWKWKVKVKSLSHVRLLATLWTAAYQAPLSMGFSRQEYWSGVPLPSPLSYLPDTKKKKKKVKYLKTRKPKVIKGKMLSLWKNNSSPISWPFTNSRV